MASPRVAPVPGGSFLMGHPRIVEGEAPNPPHTVEVRAFSLGLHPVTNVEYAAFREATGGSTPPPLGWAEPRFAGEAQPVVGVSWDEARAYCAWAGGTLPSEAQWERAARGDHAHRFPWGDEEPDEEHAHFADDWNAGGPAPIAGRPAGVGPYGHHDLAGNVWEWCDDVFQTDAHLIRVDSRPLGGTSAIRPLRGGCWRSIAPKLQCSYRNWYHRVVRHVTIGFRLCLPAS